jgi:membrane AbrB-like protein
VLTVAGAPGVAGVPELVQQLAFGIIGVEVGLRFTPASLRSAGRLLLPALGLIGALLLACFGLALALAPLAGVSTLSAYLATTPGGLYAVLAVAVGAGADTTFVLAVQVLRLLVMLVAAPALARRLSSAA